MTLHDRTNDMLERYGEVCNKSVAAKILGRSRSTIVVMLKDGRLDSACAGEMVDVRSIARYIMAPKVHDSNIRLEKRFNKLRTRWQV